MNLALLAALCGPDARAASLDLLEVGGVYGTPGATNASAVWWNPAGLASGSGTRFLVEGAPLIARVDVRRDQPTYTRAPDRAYGPETYDYSGNAVYRRATVVPFLGVASDLGQRGLGVGAALAVPHGRGAAGDPDQVTRHHLVEGGNQAIYAMVGGAYEVAERFSFGVSGAYVASTYTSDLFSEGATALNDGIRDTRGIDGEHYADTVIEDPRYSTRVVSSPLTDQTITFGLGARLKATEQLAFSVAYRHGLRVDHQGTTELRFACPGSDDVWGRLGSEINGLCNSTLTGRQSVGYNLPARLHGGVVYTPTPSVRLELMGGFVGWSVFTDYDIDIQVDPDSVPKDDPAQREETAALVSQTKQWARDSRDSGWIALDAKIRADERVTVGGRVLYDRAAVPTAVLSPNNYDADTLVVTAMVDAHLHKNLSIGVSAGQYFASPREVTDSAFAVTVDRTQRRDTRYFYPSSAGLYRSSITRLGLFVTGHFDHGSKP